MSFASGMKTIVVATDLEGQSEAALEYARKLAGRTARASCWPRDLTRWSMRPWTGFPAAFWHRLYRAGPRRAGQAGRGPAREGIHSHSEIRQGAVAQMLVDVARQYEAGLIVIGTKGRQGAGPIGWAPLPSNWFAFPCPVLAVAAGLECGRVPSHSGRAGAAGHGAQRGHRAAVATARLAGRGFPADTAGASCPRLGGGIGLPEPGRDPLEEFGLAASAEFPMRMYRQGRQSGGCRREAIAQYQPSILVAGVKRSSDTPGPHGTVFALLARSRVPVLCVPPEAVSSRRRAARAGFSRRPANRARARVRQMAGPLDRP